ncbi:TIGR03557 family F420-dependent LLM class oxidoreductase [Bailinhaonella thermotolerans]|uniref:TIGR03557 family F420-dependent LLM class oxidoreductase n=1 Tax=Bailinhaonella thermotolerans TaxID=1070861 RepID=A0A3A4B3G0_9ACTN|nr:TIGR03557 family F420-dependent LLM class oxidoreductase [Bailinhaonella thermotolerans]RJL32715.1 TIGR03557 family F420-dependent LLM class oxidoreductase [Bailinhaonella thermotolerans]
MTKFGCSLLCEQTPTKQLVGDAVGIEEAGFDFAVISDHYFPWTETLGHSAYAWSVLGGIAQATERIGLMTFVTCPTFRYHPAVVAQKAATVGLMSDGRFTLGVGAGERLNEHIVGQGWPSVDVRHEMLAEALEIIRELFAGNYFNYQGQYFTVDSARLYEMPEQGVPIGVAASGPRACDLAIKYGDGLVSDQPVGEVVARFKANGGASKPVYGQIPVSYGPDAEECKQFAYKMWNWGTAGWKVMSELPGPVNFEASAKTVRPDDVAQMVPHGPDLGTYLDTVQQWVDMGFTHMSFCQIGPDRQRAFHDWAKREFLPALRDRFGS